jgi:hypothetical protein
MLDIFINLMPAHTWMITLNFQTSAPRDNENEGKWKKENVQ